jgi:hypothetical protein
LHRSRPIGLPIVLTVSNLIAGVTIRSISLAMPAHRQVWRLDTLGADDLQTFRPELGQMYRPGTGVEQVKSSSTGSKEADFPSAFELCPGTVKRLFAFLANSLERYSQTTHRRHWNCRAEKWPKFHRSKIPLCSVPAAGILGDRRIHRTDFAPSIKYYFGPHHAFRHSVFRRRPVKTLPNRQQVPAQFAFVQHHCADWVRIPARRSYKRNARNSKVPGVPLDGPGISVHL